MIRFRGTNFGADARACNSFLSSCTHVKHRAYAGERNLDRPPAPLDAALACHSADGRRLFCVRLSGACVFCCAPMAGRPRSRSLGSEPAVAASRRASPLVCFPLCSCAGVSVLCVCTCGPLPLRLLLRLRLREACDRSDARLRERTTNEDTAAVDHTDPGCDSASDGR